MNRKLFKASALAATLMFSATALAQDGGIGTQTLLTSFASMFGDLAFFIWLILFTCWGGFRYVI